MAGIVAGCLAAAVLVGGARLARPLPPGRTVAARHAESDGVAAGARELRGAGAPVQHSRAARVRRTLAFGAPLVAALIIGGPALVGATVGGVLIRVRLAPVRAARRERARIAVELPDAIDVFVLAVSAGLTPRQAIEQLAVRAPASVRPAFGDVIARLARGEVLADALRALDDRLGPAAAPLSTLVGSADRRGLPLATVLDRLAAESRATRRRLDEAAARALPVKLSFPLVVCTLPSFVLLAIVPAVLAALSSLGTDAW